MANEVFVMINPIWSGLIISGIIISFFTGNFQILTNTIIQTTHDCIDLCISLLGPMALWLGIMEIIKTAGLTNKMSEKIRPITKIIFPELKNFADAREAITVNLTANLLGMGNAATPLGIKAMEELQKINPKKSEATPAMCTLLILNTTGITFFPATMIALRSSAGSTRPAAIMITTFLATIISSISGLIIDRIFRYNRYRSYNE